MSNELVPFKVANLPIVAEKAMGQLAEVSKGSDFLPRVQLVTKGKYVDTGKIKPGRWGVPQTGGEEITDIGDKIDVVPFAARPKALDISDRDAVIEVYDTSTPEFQRIKSAPKGTGCMWGPSFLVLERNTGKMYELFFGNASGRNEAGKLRPFLPTEANGGVPSPATMSIRYKQGTDYGWHVPVITKCSEPFDPNNCPTSEAILKEIDRFHNPKKGAEKAPEEAEGKKKRAR